MEGSEHEEAVDLKPKMGYCLVFGVKFVLARGFGVGPTCRPNSSVLGLALPSDLTAQFRC
jgi:hypothetical protein